MMRRQLTKILALIAFSCASVGSVGQKPKVCESCDCTHWPWPKECRECCGVATGTVVSSDKNQIVIRKGTQSQAFKITNKTKIVGTAQRGKDVSVYYLRGMDENLAVAVKVTAERGTSNVQTGPISQGPGSSLSINQQGGVTVGTLIVPEPPLPHVKWTEQPLAPGQNLGTFVHPMTTFGSEPEETRKRKEALRKNPGVLITASLDAALTGAEFIAECEKPCGTLEVLAMGGDNKFRMARTR